MIGSEGKGEWGVSGSERGKDMSHHFFYILALLIPCLNVSLSIQRALVLF